MLSAENVVSVEDVSEQVLEEDLEEDPESHFEIGPGVEPIKRRSLWSDGNATCPEQDSSTGRPWCDHCCRPRSICICSTLPVDGPLDTRTRVVLLVHPKEVQRALGTAPLLRLCLRHLLMKIGDRFPEPEEDPEFHAALEEGGHRCMLVCPGNNAEEMRPPAEGEEAAAEEVLFSQPPATLIFIDGRWPQAKSMVNRSVWLQQIPRVVLCPTSSSGYVFRKQPKDGCLSTLEAVSEALLALEGRRGPALREALLAPFHQMVQFQCPFIPGMRDKNAKVESSALEPFDLQGLLEDADQDPSSEVNCVVRWGDHTVEGSREVIVMEVVKSTTAHSDSKRRASQLSQGRSRGARCWVLPLSKVPPGSRKEANAVVERLSSDTRV